MHAHRRDYAAGLHSFWLSQGLYSPDVSFETDHLYIDLPGILHVMFGAPRYISENVFSHWLVTLAS